MPSDTDKTTGPQTILECLRHAGMSDHDIKAIAPGMIAEEVKPGGYPADIENPDDWAAFLARYLDNRVTNAVYNGIGLVALHIVDAIRGARANGK